MTSWPRRVPHICEFNFSLLSMSRTTWSPVRLSVFWSGFLIFPPREAEDAAASRDREQLCICRLNARTYLAAAPPAFTVWITIAHLFAAITTAVCVSGANSVFPYWFLSVFSPLINKQHFGDSSQPKYTESAHLQCGAAPCVWPLISMPIFTQCSASPRW